MGLEPLLHEPELRPFLPLLYVAWADGNLGPDERALIQTRIAEQPWLKPRLRVELEKWLDARSAPDAVTLSALRSAIVSAAKTLSPRGLSSLAAVADSISSLEPQARAAMEALERELGLDAASLHLSVERPEAGHFAKPPSFDVTALRTLLDGRFVDAREQVRTFLADPKHRAMYGVGKDEYRAQVYAWLEELAEAGFGKLAYPGVTTDADGGLGGFW